MVALINLKESLIRFYQKKEHVLRPLLKALLSFAVLYFIQTLFQHIETGRILVIAFVSLIQIFLPMAFLFFSGSVLIAYNLLAISADMCLGFALVFLICLLTYVRMEPKTAAVTMVIPVLFFLRCEYLIPVALGITAGFSGIFPAIFGTLIYYMVLYTGDASSLLINASETDLGTGLARVVNLMVIDRRMLVILVTFVLVIFITSLLYHLFYELAWLFSVTFGNAAMIFLLLCGRYIFELDFAIWRLFAEALLSVLICTIIQFFRGIGDVSRMERTSFEDDDYIYYVKAVPKIRVAEMNPNVTNISSPLLEDKTDDAGFGSFDKEDKIPPGKEENGELRRKRRAERKRIFRRKKKPEESVQDPAGMKTSGAGDMKESGEASVKDEVPKGDKAPAEDPARGEKDSQDRKDKGKKTGEANEKTVNNEVTKGEGKTVTTETAEAEGKTVTTGTAGAEGKTVTTETAGAEDKTAQDETVQSLENAVETEPAKAPGDRPEIKGPAKTKETFADAVIKGRAQKKKEKIQKLDMEDILKENIAAAKELSALDGKRQGKE